MAEKIYTQADMDAVRKLYRENTLFAVRLTVAALRSQADPNFRSDEFPLLGRMRQQTPREKQLDALLVRTFLAEQRAKELEDEAAARATSGRTATPTATDIADAVARGDAVPITAGQIVAAGKRRRGES